MKKFYTLLVASTLSLVATAQTQSAGKHVSFPIGKSEKTNLLVEKSAIWSDEFDTPSKWVLTNTSSPALNWSFSSNPNGSPVATFNPMGFATVGNGYAIINSDAEGALATQNARIEYADPIDLTGHEHVNLVFSSIYRVYQDRRVVLVSGDDGLTWTEYVVTTGEGDENGNNSQNPTVHSFNISEVAGNKEKVRIAFKYQGNYGWFWAIDDVSIVPTDDYDLVGLGTVWGVDGYFGARLPYSLIPEAQVQPINVSAVVQNAGIYDITDATVVASVATTSYSSTAVANIEASSTSTIDLPDAYTPQTGLNTIEFSIFTEEFEEENLNNNGLQPVVVEVNDHIYARDMNGVDGGLYNQGIGYEIGNVFDIFSNAVVTAVDVHISENTTVGTQVFAKLYSVEDDFFYMTESSSYQVTSSDLGTTLTLMLLEPQSLQANRSYLAVAGSFGNGGVSNDLVIVSSGISEPQTSFLFDEGDGEWYYVVNTPKVRLNFDASLSLSNAANVDGVSIYPNPSTGLVTISSDKADNYSVVVTDLAGKIILTKNGTDAITIDLSDNGAGVYFVEVTNGSTSKVEKLIIK